MVWGSRVDPSCEFAKPAKPNKLSCAFKSGSQGYAAWRGKSAESAVNLAIQRDGQKMAEVSSDCGFDDVLVQGGKTDRLACNTWYAGVDDSGCASVAGRKLVQADCPCSSSLMDCY